MSADTVTVAIPVLDGADHLVEVLDAVTAQRLDRPVEVLVVDSGSRDGSPRIARQHGATVIEIPPGEFSHGGTRNLLMERSSGSHVAFLTQDATPADDRWLARLLAGFGLADEVALVGGPYVPRAGAEPAVRRELEDFFAGLAPDGEPALVRGSPPAGPAGTVLPAPSTFFSDANGCVARWAWRRVPFRDVAYAEDRLLALDMLEAGFAKAFVPGAAVVHSHDYTALEHFRRCFDEWRGLREVFGHVEPIAPRRTAAILRRAIVDDRRLMRRQGASPAQRIGGTARSARHHALRAAGAALGSRADRLPPWMRQAFSLERRAGFEPVPPHGPIPRDPVGAGLPGPGST